MDVQSIRLGIARAPRDRLPELRSMISRAYSTGAINDAQYEELFTLCDICQVGVAPLPRRSHAGTRPRTSESMVRRRQLAAAGELPAPIAGRFTQGERAVLVVIGREVTRGGDCRCCHEKLAALAGVSKTTVKRAIREARALGFITVEERRAGHRRNDPSIIRIVAPEWLASMRLSPKSRSIAALGIIAAANQGQLAPPTQGKELYKERAGRLNQEASGGLRFNGAFHSGF